MTMHNDIIAKILVRAASVLRKAGPACAAGTESKSAKSVTPLPKEALPELAVT